MQQTETSEGVKAWLREIDTKLDNVRETAIRTESKLEAYSQRTGDTESEIKAHDLRLNEVESRVAEIQGGQRMLQWIGGVIGGLVLIGQLAVMIFKG